MLGVSGAEPQRSLEATVHGAEAGLGCWEAEEGAVELALGAL